MISTFTIPHQPFPLRSLLVDFVEHKSIDEQQVILERSVKVLEESVATVNALLKELREKRLADSACPSCPPRPPA